MQFDSFFVLYVNLNELLNIQINVAFVNDPLFETIPYIYKMCSLLQKN